MLAPLIDFARDSKDLLDRCDRPTGLRALLRRPAYSPAPPRSRRALPSPFRGVALRSHRGGEENSAHLPPPPPPPLTPLPSSFPLCPAALASPRPFTTEFYQISLVTGIGFLILGSLGVAIKLIHIPINNLLVREVPLSAHAPLARALYQTLTSPPPPPPPSPRASSILQVSG